ncbi:hypothetical protein [Pedobacter endophyticus]|uniref:DUF3649 domain-containing protein n=1 Tax=Pedobacter endophyticus TaxID=2789740 RepID=A0A7S9KZ87_9SPHI|nr:hypothetical protein [Pedobacter endophyticus]QPH39319.1 hypothetical protein IZT61_20110 [Pedobacter endophyticus]
MPANKKHLTKSPWLRLVKILTGTIGGYTVMLTFHLLLSKLFLPQNIVVTSFITGYILWAVLLLMSFLAKNVWKVLGMYVALTVLFSGVCFIV